MSETALAVQPQAAPPPNPLGAGAQSMIDYVAAIASPAALHAAKQFANAYNEVCAALIGDDDMQQAERGKFFKKKSAWRKLGRHFGVSTEIVHKERGWETDERTGERFYYAEVHVRGTAPWGQSMVAVGACDTRESRFTGRGAQQAMAKMGNDVLATAETRATNRAISNLIAAGEVSAEEVQGGYTGDDHVQEAHGVVLAGDDQLAELRTLADRVNAAASKWLEEKIADGIPLDDVPIVFGKLNEHLRAKEEARARKRPRPPQEPQREPADDLDRVFGPDHELPS